MSTTAQARRTLAFIAVLCLLSPIADSTNGNGSRTCECDGRLVSESHLAALRGLTLDTLHQLQTERGLSLSEVCALSADRLARAIYKVKHPMATNPGEALQWRLMRMQDENGFIPNDGLAKAAAHIRQMRESAFHGAQSAAGISVGGWTWIGPGNIGGRTRGLVVHPTNPETMFLGSVGGGIWKTTDGGTSWHAVNDFMANLAVSTIVMNPANTNILYAGTGEGFYNGDRIRGAGIFKSTDGGDTWNQLSSTAISNFNYVNRLSMSANGSVILAATSSGIFRSSDAGNTWTQTLTVTDITNVAFNKTDSTAAIACGYYGRTYYSTDGGLTWSSASGIPSLTFTGRVEAAYAASNPSIVYAGVNQNGGEVWKSMDGGRTYSRVNTGNNFMGSQGWYDNLLWVDPTNPNTVVVGGIDLWRSTDGGTTLTKISQWQSAPNSAHADNHIMVEHPSYNGTSNRTVFVGNDGGVYKANNILGVSTTSGWQELNNNLGITQFYGASGNPTNNVIIGGTQDNGTLRYTGNSEGWTSMFGGDGGWCASDPADPNYHYGEYVYLYLHRSANGGQSSSYIYSGISDAGSGSTANFIAPFILDPNNSSTLLAGGANLWRSTNAKASTPSWSNIKSSVGSNISTIAVAKNNSNVIWVGHNNGDVYMTANGTATAPAWVRQDTNSPNLPNRSVTRLAIDPGNSSVVLASFGGFSSDNIYRTSNAGATWTDITGSGTTGLPDVPVYSLAIHPTNSNWIYAGTETGVFASENGGSTWSVPQDGPANVSVDELFWMNSTLVAVTHGRGIFTSLTGPSTTTAPSFTITMSKSTYSTGDTITATEFRLQNPSSTAIPGKLRVWLNIPTIGEVSLIDVGSDGSFSLPPNLDANLGPLSMMAITSSFPPRGTWEFNSRITNPTSGVVLNQDLNTFVIQ